MANGKDHMIYGAIAGGACLVLSAVADGHEISWAELIGAIAAGTCAAKLPDFLEPAIHPNHRSFFHSVGFVGTAGPAFWSFASQKRNEALRLAEEYEKRAKQAQTEQEAQLYRRQAHRYRFLAGLWLGATAGYLSHLAADALTPKGLPLLG